MKIGSVPASYDTSSKESRLRGIESGPGIRPIAMPDFGAALAQTGAELSRAVNIYTQAEGQRADIRALTEFTRFRGEAEREALETQKLMPEDGAGYAKKVEEIYARRYGAFSSKLEPWQEEEFGLRGEVVRQQMLSNALNFETTAARGFAINAMNALLDERLGSIYDSPGAAEALENDLGEMLLRSPLTEVEKKELAQKFTRQIQGVSFAGEAQNRTAARFAAPGSDESSIWMNAIHGVETNFGAVKSDSPKGALGPFQVMPATGAEIAQKLGDTAFPADEEARKEYLRRDDVSARYGKFYFEEGLRLYGGDVTLALIRYNGGGRRADEFVREGRNPAVLPSETKAYVEKAYRIAGRGNPWRSAADDINREGLTPDQRAQLDTLDQNYDEAVLRASATISAEQDKAALLEVNRALETALAKAYSDPAKASDFAKEIDGAIDALSIGDAAKADLKAQAQAKFSGALALRSPEDVMNTDKFPGLSFEDRVRLGRQGAEEARLRQDAAEKAAEGERLAKLNALELTVAYGTKEEGEAAIREAIKAQLFDPRRRENELRAILDKFETTHGARLALERGQPMTPTQADAVIPQAMIPGLQEKSPEAAGDLVALSRRIGFVPPAAFSTLRSMLNSPDLEQIYYANSVLEEMRTLDGTLVEGLTAQDRAMQNLISGLQNAEVPATDALAIIKAARDPRQRKLIEEAKAKDPTYEEMRVLDAEKLLEDQTGWFSYLGINTSLFPGMGGTDIVLLGEKPEAPKNFAMRAQLVADWNSLYDSRYILDGNAEEAAKFANENIQNNWKITGIGASAGQLSFLPPEATLSRVKENVPGQKEPQVYVNDPAAVQEYFDRAVRREFGFTPSQRYLVMPGPRAQIDAQNMRAPEYMIFPVNDEGQIVIAAPGTQAFARMQEGGFRMSWKKELDLEQAANTQVRERAAEVERILVERQQLIDANGPDDPTARVLARQAIELTRDAP